MVKVESTQYLIKNVKSLFFMIELNWYKIGYQNYNYFLARKRICYSGKKITFTWNLAHFQNTLILFAPYIYPKENKSYNKYLEEKF